MIIKRLTMHNFGVYASTNILEFQSNKPVVLIGGMNGRGKTTILEAILLSLYGANSFAYKESRYATYGQYLKSYVNRSDGSLKTYIELEFSIVGKEEEIYCVKREWEGKGVHVHEKISVKKNDEENIFLTENWSMFIENILPSALANFFFFDGEKIAELAVEETSAQMKESIKAMLGINILDVLRNDIGKVINRINKKNIGAQEFSTLEKLKEAKNTAFEILANADQKIKNGKFELKKLELELERLNTEYSAKGGGILKQKNFLMNQRSENMVESALCQEQLLEIVGGELPLTMVGELLKQIECEGKRDHEYKTNNMALKTIKNMYDKFEIKSSDINEFIEFLQKDVESHKPEGNYNLSEVSLHQIALLNSSKLSQSSKRAKRLIARKGQLKKKIDEIDNSLSVDINEKLLRDLFNRIKEKERSIMEKQVEIKDNVKRRASLHGNFITAESEFTKYVEMTLADLELADKNKRKLKYANMAIEIIKLYKIRLQERKIDLLANTMTACYKKLANKKDWIECVEIDPRTLDLRYIGREGEEISNKRLSAGEKQLMVISLLWALAICSEKRLPVIIDTPLSRLDSCHRQALIRTYFPQASDQTIILSTDSEIDEYYYNMMRDKVGNEFTLEYDDKTKTTAIKTGYFGWKRGN